MPPNTHKTFQEAETDVIEQALEKHNKNCPFRREKDTWFNSQMLKVGGVVIGILSPLFVWIVVNIFTIQGEVALVKQRQETIMEIKNEIIEMRKDLTAIKIQIAGITQGKP